MTFILIPGAGSGAWSWHLVVAELERRGHEAVAVDLPCDDDSAGLEQYTDVVVDAISHRRQDLVLVAQSLAAFTAPLVAQRLPVRLIVLVAAVVPAPGESPGEWWANTGHVFPEPFDEREVFLHDVPAELAAASATHARPQSGTPFEKPWPLERWPDVPTRFLLCRDDRFFPADFQRRVVAERLGIVPDEMDGGHLPALAHPVELAGRLHDYWTEIEVGGRGGT